MKRFLSILLICLCIASAAQSQGKDSKNPRLVADDPDGTCYLDWARDSKHVQVSPANERQFVQWGVALLDLEGHIQKDTLLPPPRLQIEQSSGESKLEIYFSTDRTSRPLQGTASDDIFGFNPDEPLYGFHFQAFHFSKDEREVSIIASGTIYRWSVANGKLLSRVRLTEPQSWNSDHTFAQFSPDGRLVVASLASAYGAAVFSSRTGQKMFLVPNPQQDWRFRVGFLAGSRLLGCQETTPNGDKPQFSIWSVQQQRRLWSCPNLGGYKPHYIQSHNLIVTVGPTGLQLRDVATGRIERTLFGPSKDVNDVAPSPDGSQIWTSQNNGEIWSWRIH